MTYFENSVTPAPSLEASIAGAVIASLILAHDRYLHTGSGTAEAVWSPIRKLTVLAVVASLLADVCYLSCLTQTCGTAWLVIGSDVLAAGVFPWIAKACDLYVCYERYHILCGLEDGRQRELSVCFRACTCVFAVVSISILTPYYTILPFFGDANTPTRHALLLVEIPLYLLYLICFTALAYFRLRELKESHTPPSLKLKFAGIGYRAIAHSACAAVALSLNTFHVFTAFIQKSTFICLGLHLFLNWNTVRVLDVCPWICSVTGRARGLIRVVMNVVHFAGVRLVGVCTSAQRTCVPCSQYRCNVVTLYFACTRVSSGIPLPLRVGIDVVAPKMTKSG
jgi:hypothetical protein